MSEDLSYKTATNYITYTWNKGKYATVDDLYNSTKHGSFQLTIIGTTS